jgi:hypothetical protein
MKESNEQLDKAVVIVAESLGIGEAAKLLLINVGLHSTVKELTYQMFVQDKQQYFEKDDDVFEAISLIRKYCKEMSLNGEVNFNRQD